MDIVDRIIISEEDIQRRVRELGKAISQDYAGKEITLLCVLKGGLMFLCDLAKHITVPVAYDFMSVSSYGDATESSGVVRIVKDLEESIEGKHILIVEDIIDTGLTLSYLYQLLQSRNPATLKTAVLLDKPERRRTDFTPDYVGFTIPDKFVIGYGLDYNHMHRELPYVGVLEN